MDQSAAAILLENLDLLQNGKVLCVGDVMLDRFHYGSVERISPEAPIPVFLHQREYAMLGGAANTALNCITLGGKAVLLSIAGDDSDAQNLENLINDKISRDGFLYRDSTRRTIIKDRFIASNHQMLRVDYENRHPINADIEAVILEKFSTLLTGCNAIIISDYGKGLLTPSLLQAMIALAAEQKIATVVDPKGRDYMIYHGATAVTPNLKELAEASGMPAQSDDEVVAAARHILASCTITSVIATRGPHGMTIVTSDSATHIPTRAREVWDVSGAGDTVIATIATALGSGIDLKTAAQLANYAAGVVVGKVGTATATPDEIRDVILGDTEQLAIDKFADWPRAKEQVERWRARGHKIGFTNGVFDLLHSGHVYSLQQARKACDKLVVAINSDASVKRLKGATRPVVSEAERAVMLSALQSVDLVVMFEDDTPYEIIKSLVPDFLIKGMDYQGKKVVGSDIVERHGGKVILADLKPGFSTTDIIAKLQNEVTK